MSPILGPLSLPPLSLLGLASASELWSYPRSAPSLIPQTFGNGLSRDLRVPCPVRRSLAFPNVSGTGRPLDRPAGGHTPVNCRGLRGAGSESEDPDPRPHADQRVRREGSTRRQPYPRHNTLGPALTQSTGDTPSLTGPPPISPRPNPTDPGLPRTELRRSLSLSYRRHVPRASPVLQAHRFTQRGLALNTDRHRLSYRDRPTVQADGSSRTGRRRTRYPSRRHPVEFRVECETFEQSRGSPTLRHSSLALISDVGPEPHSTRPCVRGKLSLI